MQDSERRAWLSLARTENVGPVTFRNLIARFGSASAALENLPRMAARGGGKAFVLPDASETLRELETLTECAQDILSVLSPMLGDGFREPETPASYATEAMEAEADRIRAAVKDALGPAPVEIDELIRQLGAPAAAVLTVILELELAGRCARQPGNRVCWK